MRNLTSIVFATIRRSLSAFTLVLLFASVALCGDSVSTKNQTITFTTTDWPPYIGTNLESQGYVAKIVREAFATQGYTVKFDFQPWARAIRALQSTDKAGYLPEYYSSALVDVCIFSDPFPGGPLSLIALGKTNNTAPSISELEGRVVGVVRGYVNTEAIDANSAIIKEDAISDLANLRKLKAGRIDYIIGDPYVIDYLNSVHFPNDNKPITILRPALLQHDLYVCFNRNHPQYETIVQAFNAGLAALKESGALQRHFTRLRTSHSTPNLPTPRQ